MLNRTVWKSFQEIFLKFGKAYGMMENNGKSCIYYEEEGRYFSIDIASSFNFCTAPLSLGFKYLGFQMKSNNYKIKDWEWLVEKVKKKIKGWTFKWLSSGGRFILVQVVIQNIMVYWVHIYAIRKIF